MALGVVKLFEVVQIQKYDGQWVPIALRAIDFEGPGFEKSPSVLQPCQGVTGREFVLSFKLQANLSNEESHQAVGH